MKSIKSTFLALIAILLSPLGANADPIVTSGPCEDTSEDCFLSILGFEFGGSTYDVTWIEGPYDDVLATDSGVTQFIGDQTSAETVANLINDLFLSAGGGSTFYGSPSPYDWNAVYVPYEVTDTEISSYVAFSSLDVVTNPTYARTSILPLAVFSPTSVPEPSTLILLGIGLAALGLSRRRRKI